MCHASSKSTQCHRSAVRVVQALLLGLTLRSRRCPLTAKQPTAAANAAVIPPGTNTRSRRSPRPAGVRRTSRLLRLRAPRDVQRRRRHHRRVRAVPMERQGTEGTRRPRQSLRQRPRTGCSPTTSARPWIVAEPQRAARRFAGARAERRAEAAGNPLRRYERPTASSALRANDGRKRAR